MIKIKTKKPTNELFNNYYKDEKVSLEKIKMFSV